MMKVRGYQSQEGEERRVSIKGGTMKTRERGDGSERTKVEAKAKAT